MLFALIAGVKTCEKNGRISPSYIMSTVGADTSTNFQPPPRSAKLGEPLSNSSSYILGLDGLSRNGLLPSVLGKPPHDAAVGPDAIKTCPLTGAAALETATTEDADRNPLAIRSSLKRASFPCANVFAAVPKAGKAWR